MIGADVQGATMLVRVAVAVLGADGDGEGVRRASRCAASSSTSSTATCAAAAASAIEELPLMRVENQDYIHYRKGSLVMYALRDEIGEGVVNRALRGFLQRRRSSRRRIRPARARRLPPRADAARARSS